MNGSFLLNVKSIVTSFWDGSPYKGQINQLSVDDTISCLKEKKCSLARFGDGELAIMAKTGSVGFQENNDLLATRLKDVLMAGNPKLIIGLPDQFSYLKNSVRRTRKFWLDFIQKHKDVLSHCLNSKVLYGNTNISRFYMVFREKDKAQKRFSALRGIWDGEDVLLVEGSYSRSGVGNELYSNAKSVSRILCPPKNAFNFYDDILSKVKEYGKGKLILLALGPTATILAHDLSKEDYIAIDLGHMDVEYMWMLNNAKTKVSIAGRYVNETSDGVIGEELSSDDLELYNKEVIDTVIG